MECSEGRVIGEQDEFRQKALPEEGADGPYQDKPSQQQRPETADALYGFG
jgi:hypothetical protein